MKNVELQITADGSQAHRVLDGIQKRLGLMQPVTTWQGTVTKIGAIALAVLALAGIHAATDIKTLENDVIVGGGAALSAYTVGKDLLHKIVDRVKGKPLIPHG